jgi:8-oxo-dGTP pyrophosphatase MutT (NUDIX family)
MKHDDLVWREESSRVIGETRVFSIRESLCRAPSGQTGLYTSLDAPDWAVIVPVVTGERGRQFVMVRQWRHGSRDLSLEFPGGVFEAGENGAAAAARELREETAYTPGTVRLLGVMSPNPAIMANQVHFFAAEDLAFTGAQHLDADEYITVELVDTEDVIRGMGKPPYTHALMAAALMLYLREV